MAPGGGSSRDRVDFCRKGCRILGAGGPILSRRRLNQRRAGDWRLCSNPGKSGDFKMKWTTLTAALVLFAGVNSASAGLFGHHGLCHKKSTCCPEPTCCAPVADPGCAAPCDPGCAAPCAPACAAPCDPGCAAPACCAPAPNACCAPACGSGCGSKKCCGGLMGWFKKHRRGGCCGATNDCCAPAPSCCAPACDPGCAAPACAPSCASPCGACR